MYCEYKIDTGLAATKTIKARSDKLAWNKLAKMMYDEYKQKAAGVLYKKIYVVTRTNDPSIEHFLSSARAYWLPVAVGIFDKDYDGKAWVK